MHRRVPFLILLVFVFFRSFCQMDNVGSGRAIKFDGIDDLIELGNIYDDLSLPFSVSVWVYMDPGNTQAGPILVSQDNAPLYNGFWFFVTYSNIFIEYGDGRGENLPAYRRGKTAPGQDLSGRWVHATAVMKSANDVDLYINGINVGGSISGESNLPMASNYPNDIAKIGYFLSNGVTYRFKGIMDELRIFNSALTQAEIRDTMCKKLKGNEPGLIGYWNFDEESDNILFDQSPKGFHGQLKGNPERVFSGAPLGDESVNLYTGSWSGVILLIQDGDDKVEMSNITGNTQGVHIYEVKNLPSQTGGLNTSVTESVYFGVFSGSVNNNNSTFNVSYSNARNEICKLFTRADNSVAEWYEQPNPLAVTMRKEMIKIFDTQVFDIDLGTDLLLCDKESANLSASVDPEGKIFLWSTGQNTPSITVTQSGIYTLNVVQGCSGDKDTIVVQMAKTPLPISLGDDKVFCGAESTILKITIDTLGVEFTWHDGSHNTSYLVLEEGLYWVKKENACGLVSDSIRFARQDFSNYEIPNIITPNEDEFNQYFILDPLLLGSDFAVYNRWGKKVYESLNYQNDWDGSGLASGVYFYTITGSCIGDLRGTITIVR